MKDNLLTVRQLANISGMGTEEKYAEGLMVLAARLAQLELDLGSAVRFLSDLISEENDGEGEPVRDDRSGEDPGGQPGDRKPDDPQRPTALRAEAARADRVVPVEPQPGHQDGQAEGRLSHWERQQVYEAFPLCETAESLVVSCLWCHDTGVDPVSDMPCPECEMGQWNTYTELWDDARQGR